MRIDELTGYRNNKIFLTFKNASSVKDFLITLKQNNFEITTLGSGLYAYVFNKPGTPFVYKLFTATDTGYLKYLNYVKQNQNNPHVPKVYGMVRVEMPYMKPAFQKSSNWFLLKMERLTELPPTQTTMYNKIRSYLYNRNEEFMEKFYKKYPEMAEVLDWIIENDKTKNLDIHDKNIMMRGNTIVITDPFSSI